MNWRQLAADYFSFSRRERIGLVVLLIIIGGTSLLPFFSSNGNPRVIDVPDSALAALIRPEPAIPDTAEKITRNYKKLSRSYNEGEMVPKPEVFPFDPNTVSPDGWKKLGISERTIRTIQNYLSRGGRFTEPGDLKKIYGLRPADFERLLPYISIEMEQKNTGRVHSVSSRPIEAPRKRKTEPIDINSADSTQWISLPGIGSRLAARIMLFREKLGGFHSIGQVAETYGLPDSTFQQIRPYLLRGNEKPMQININTATAEELKSHPYIRSAIATAIINYRREHGDFADISDLKKLMIITDEVYQKLQHYVGVK